MDELSWKEYSTCFSIQLAHEFTFFCSDFSDSLNVFTNLILSLRLSAWRISAVGELGWEAGRKEGHVPSDLAVPLGAKQRSWDFGNSSRCYPLKFSHLCKQVALHKLEHWTCLSWSEPRELLEDAVPSSFNDVKCSVLWSCIQHDQETKILHCLLYFSFQ